MPLKLIIKFGTRLHVLGGLPKPFSKCLRKVRDHLLTEQNCLYSVFLTQRAVPHMCSCVSELNLFEVIG